MPALTGVNLRGDTITGQAGPAIYFFSFIGCGPCGQALDDMAASDFGLWKGARLIYVNARDRPGQIDAYLAEKYGRDAFSVLLPSREQVKALGVAGYPTMVKVNAKGRIVGIREGYGLMSRKWLLR